MRALSKEPTDAALLEAVASDPGAFVAFYDRYERAVVGYFARRVFDPELVADLTAELFATVLAAAGRYRASEPTAAGWLFTIAHNLLANSIRRRRVEERARTRLGIRDAVSFADDELERVEAIGSESGWLIELLARLPADQADAVRAKVLEEKGYPEIAAALNTSSLVVRKRVSRGLSALRHELEQERRA